MRTSDSGRRVEAGGRKGWEPLSQALCVGAHWAASDYDEEEREERKDRGDMRLEKHGGERKK